MVSPPRPRLINWCARHPSRIRAMPRESRLVGHRRRSVITCIETAGLHSPARRNDHLSPIIRQGGDLSYCAASRWRPSHRQQAPAAASYGVTAPVRPTWNSSLATPSDFFHAGILCAMAQRGSRARKPSFAFGTLRQLTLEHHTSFVAQCARRARYLIVGKAFVTTRQPVFSSRLKPSNPFTVAGAECRPGIWQIPSNPPDAIAADPGGARVIRVSWRNEPAVGVRGLATVLLPASRARC